MNLPLTTGIVDRTLVVTLNRPDVRNAVDRSVAADLADAFWAFDRDPELHVAILTGADDTFCVGVDQGADAAGMGRRVREDRDAPGPLGCTRMLLGKPVIAAIEGHAVAGGLELALWCDLRVAATDAVFGVFGRRWAHPLVDGGTVRLPRLIGTSRALDMVLTGRPISGPEALAFGLVNRLCAPGEALTTALELGHELAALPQTCLRSDRRSVHEQAHLSLDDALANETRHGLEVVRGGATDGGTSRVPTRVGRPWRRT
jgi:enoyl-CoA hydratase